MRILRTLARPYARHSLTLLVLPAALAAQGTVVKPRTTTTPIARPPAGSTVVAQPTAGSTGGTPSATTMPVPPSAVSVDASWSPYVTVYFGFTQSGMSYRIERAMASASAKTAVATWQLRQTTGPLPCCSFSVADSSSDLPASAGVMYRVTTVSPTVQMRVPPATISAVTYVNSGVPGQSASSWFLNPTRMTAMTARVGTPVGIAGEKTITFDTSVVSVYPSGQAMAVKPGVTSVFWVTVSASGEPRVHGARVTVVP